MRDLGIGCLGILVGVFCGAIAALLFLTSLQTGAARPITEAVILPDQPDVTITASAPFVSAQMQDAIRQSGVAKDAKVALASPNLVQISTLINVDLLGQSLGVNTTATMSVAVKNGRAVLTTERVDVGGVNAPANLVSQRTERFRATGEDQLNRIIQRSLQGTGLHLVNVRISSESVSVDLSSR